MNLNIALFNFGNSEKSHEKAVSITLENNTIFDVEEGFDTQFVTIPSAANGGDFGATGFCETGEACVNVSFPITKFDLTEIGVFWKCHVSAIQILERQKLKSDFYPVKVR